MKRLIAGFLVAFADLPAVAKTHSDLTGLSESSLKSRNSLSRHRPNAHTIPAEKNSLSHNLKKEPIVIWRTLLAGLIALCAASVSAQNLRVKVVNQQDKEDEYDYAAIYNNVAVGKSFKVHGATLTLQLPDGRLAIVNCESKFAEHMAGPVGNRRSCRIPLVENIEADFKGDNAKLIWSVSLDGKKMQSETYKILAVLDKPS